MSDLQRLKGSQRVRQRVNVIFGNSDIRGCQHSLFEIATNSIDRFKRGYGNLVRIIKHKDLSYTVEDFADGLPMKWNENENAYNWDLALKVLYAGDNYEDETETLGENGLGLTSSQYSSEFMTATSYRDGKKYTVKCKKGRPIDKDSEEYICEDDDLLFTKEQGERVLKIEEDDNKRTGTIINYKPDLEVFTEINIPTEWILEKFKKQAFVNKGLKIEIIDEIEDETYVLYYENGIKDYIAEISNDNNITDIIEFNDKGKGRDREDKSEYDARYEIVFTFNNEINELKYFHNSSELLQGGVTAEAIEKAFTDTIHNYIDKNNLYTKGEKRIKFVDIQDSLICIISSFSTRTSYSNQTKLSIDNKFIKDFVTESLKNKLEIYFIENKMETDKIANQILNNMRARTKAEKTRIDIKKKLQGTSNGLSAKIKGVKDCDMKNSILEERIFLIDEGVSANSTITSSFDSRIMGALGLRGRFINSLKSSVEDVLNNEPALGVIQALGCGIEIPKTETRKYKGIETFNIENLRYGIIGLLCDADAFGKGINLSLLTFFYNFMPTLLKQGRIYIVRSPRYELKTKDMSYYAYDENEKIKYINMLDEQKIKYEITIRKGLGEFNKDEFWEYVLSEKAREKTFIQVKYIEDQEEMIKYYFDMFMGEDIENRKKFIRQNITNINLDEIE